MNNRSKLKFSQMTSACFIYEEMMMHPANPHRHVVGGGPGFSTSGNVVFTASDTINTYDEDTNALVRAKFACEKDWVVSPFSKDRLFYTKRENFPADLQAAEHQAEQDAKPFWRKRK